jgi:hypothetical protein
MGPGSVEAIDVRNSKILQTIGNALSDTVISNLFTGKSPYPA